MKKIFLIILLFSISNAQSLTETITFEDGTTMTTIVDENGIYSDRDIDTIDSTPSSAVGTLGDGSSIYGNFSDDNISIVDDEGNVLLDVDYDDVMSELYDGDISDIDIDYDYDSSYDYDIDYDYDSSYDYDIDW